MYEKTLGAHQGAVYVVAGVSGRVFTDATTIHPVMVSSLYALGSMVIDVNGDQLDAMFLDDSGLIQDYFTIRKN